MTEIPEVSAGPGPAADKEPGVGAYDVIVVGAGPVGLWLAAELHRGGVRTAVLERRAERPPHSKALTIYPRTPSAWTTILGDTQMTDPPPGRALTLNQPGGSIYMVALGDGRWRLATIDHATLADPVGKPVTFGDLRASALRLAGTDFGMRETADTWLSRVGDEARHAAAYRDDRVLLAGDAAHIHYPAGGQGLNLGLQDATNLGWKLAATVRGWAPDGLLDTYHAERARVAVDVIADSRAQCALFANPTPAGIALRDRFNTLLGAHESLRRDLALRLSGLAVSYAAPGSGSASAIGRRVPDLALRGAAAASVYGLLRSGKFILLALSQGVSSRPSPSVLAGYRDRLDARTAELADQRPDWSDVRALLIRPDGHVAWVLGDGDPPALPPLASWLGSPSPVSQ